jgi:hypothetical protein
MELRDIYKLIYQGAMGAEHSHPSAGEFITRLVNEFEQLTPNHSERILEPVRSDGSLSRLNLRAYKCRYQSAEQLIPCLLATVRTAGTSLDGLISNWQEFIDACAARRITTFSPEESEQFTRWLEENGYPAIHHSTVYRENYKPAYRLIAGEYILQLGLSHAG